MRAVVQRVTEARVEVDDRVAGQIGRGFLVLVGVPQGDGLDDIPYMTRKIERLRVFSDGQSKMNLPLSAVGGQILLISQFTLLGDVRQGNRPSYAEAAAPEVAGPVFEQLRQALVAEGLHVETGVFQAMMQVHLVNDGPVTILLDSRRGF
ncbi:MAG: D-aminoacyl-tRNA deacylase [Acidobacteriota bacterium]